MMQQWAAGLGWPLEGLLRLLLAGLAGGLVGLERETRGRQAGFRTNLLVCVGSALVMMVSIQFAKSGWRPTAGFTISIDPARVAYGVMTGIGFLGAGTILHYGSSVRGLTTAAGLWCVAAIGLAVGLGMYVLSGLAVLVVVGALWALDYVEDWLPKMHHRTVTVRRTWKSGCIRETIQRFKEAKLTVTDASMNRTADLRFADIKLRVAFVNRRQYFDLERQLEGDAEYELISTSEE
jgi:putative Mg2+ transporter-C (MgtC) family protein